MSAHPGHVQPVVGLGLLADRVEPGERGAAGAGAGDPGVDREHARPRAGRRVDGVRAHDAETDHGDVVVAHEGPPGEGAAAIRVPPLMKEASRASTMNARHAT